MLALATCVNERKEPDALGIFVEITSPKFLATILMLCDIFAGVQPLNLTLQKSGESLILDYIPVYLDKTMSFLEKLMSANKRPFFTKPNFNNVFMKEVEGASSQLDFWMAFNILDPRALPEELDLLDEYGADELDKLPSYDGDDKFDI